MTDDEEPAELPVMAIDPEHSQYLAAVAEMDEYLDRMVDSMIRGFGVPEHILRGEGKS